MTQPIPRQAATAADKQGLAGNSEDLQKHREVYGQSQEQDQGDEQDLELDVPRPLVPAAKPAPDQGGQEGADDRYDCQVDQLFRQMVMAHEKPLDDLDKEPAAADEGRQDRP